MDAVSSTLAEVEITSRNSFGEYLKARRETLDLDQSKVVRLVQSLAKEQELVKEGVLFLPQPTLSSWELGKTLPTQKQNALQRIAFLEQVLTLPAGTLKKLVEAQLKFNRRGSIAEEGSATGSLLKKFPPRFRELLGVILPILDRGDEELIQAVDAVGDEAFTKLMTLFPAKIGRLLLQQRSTQEEV